VRSESSKCNSPIASDCWARAKHPRKQRPSRVDCINARAEQPRSDMIAIMTQSELFGEQKQ